MKGVSHPFPRVKRSVLSHGTFLRVSPSCGSPCFFGGSPRLEVFKSPTSLFLRLLVFSPYRTWFPVVGILSVPKDFLDGLTGYFSYTVKNKRSRSPVDSV